MPALKRRIIAGALPICASALLLCCASPGQAQHSSSAAGNALMGATLWDATHTGATPMDVTHVGVSGGPVMAIVALSQQRITVYGANGPILRAPVSSGRPGYETPAGIYSVIQKEAEHYSNLYDDASMPFMQRITWSGIALHAGAVPSYPASHGCVRMPYAFAEQLFELTKIGMRVIVVRDDMSPAEISHPKLLQPGPIRSAAATDAAQGISALRAMRLDAGDSGEGDTIRTWWSIAIAKAAAAELAVKKAEEARRVAIKANTEVAKATRTQRRAEVARRRIEARLRVLQRLEGAVEPLAIAPIDELKLRAQEQLSEANNEIEILRNEAQPMLDTALAAREQIKLAQDAAVAAHHEADMAEAKATPISVFISRKTQRLYARQASGPIFESDVTITAPDEPVGTFVFTALGSPNPGGKLRWGALAMYANPTNPGAAAPRQTALGRSGTGAAPTNTAAAMAALDRISIPPEALEQVSEFVSPGSSLIISDEEMSKETGKDTEFVVLMSSELQGGIRIRRRAYSAF